MTTFREVVVITVEMVSVSIGLVGSLPTSWVVSMRTFLVDCVEVWVADSANALAGFLVSFTSGLGRVGPDCGYGFGLVERVGCIILDWTVCRDGLNVTSTALCL